MSPFILSLTDKHITSVVPPINAEMTSAQAKHLGRPEYVLHHLNLSTSALLSDFHQT